MQIEDDIVLTSTHPKDITMDEWIADLNHFFDMMTKNNPYFYLKQREHGYVWTDLLQQYEKRMKAADQISKYLEVLYDAVQALQTGHSVIIGANLWEFLYAVKWYRTAKPYCKIFSEEMNNYYDYWKPILSEYVKKRLFYEFEVLIMYDRGVYRIVDGHGKWKEKYGENTIITSVDDKPILEAVTEAFEKGLFDFDFKRNWWHLWKIAPRHFGADAEFTIKTNDGVEEKVIFQSSADFVYPNPLRFPEDKLYTMTWPEKKAGYVRIGEFSEQTIDDDKNYLFEFYKQIEDYDLLIIDVRGNGGGTYKVWMENVISPLAKKSLESKMYLAYRQASYVNMFRETSELGPIVSGDELSETPPEVKSGEYLVHAYPQLVEPSGEFNYNGRIIVLTDTFTYSATDAFALFCKETGFAKLYGTPTGGDGISYSPIYYILPNSKLVVRFTPAMGLDYTGSANEEVRVKPDVFYESKFGDWDELIQYVLETEI